MSSDPKPTAPVAKTCNFNCTCNRDACSYNHYLSDLKDRLKMKEIWDEVFDRREHNETDPSGVRTVTCHFGILCNNEACNFKHYCNFTGRQVLAQAWKEHKAEVRTKLVEDIKSKITVDELAQLVKLLGVQDAKKV